MTVIELWYFLSLLAALIAGGAEGYEQGGIMLGLLGTVVGLLIGVGTVVASTLPSWMISKFSGIGQRKIDEDPKWILNLIALTFAVCVAATPLAAVWLTAVSVELISALRST